MIRFAKDEFLMKSRAKAQRRKEND